MASADSNGEFIARRVSARADQVEKRYLSLVAALYLALSRARTEQQAQEILAKFIADFGILAAFAASSREWADDLMASIYGSLLVSDPQAIMGIQANPATAGLLNRSLFAEQESLIRQLQQMVSRGTDRARSQAVLSGRPLAQELSKLALSKQDAYNLRRVLDSAVVNAAQHSIWLSGIGSFRRKIVVGVRDKDQTPLCRRLDGTVWKWDEMIVDPVSGGRRMFPPFVGSDYDPTYHPCRSIAVPYFG